MKKRDITYKEPEKKAPTLKPNTRFLKNVVLCNMSSNKHREMRRQNTAKTQEGRDAKRFKSS